jgi:hypothetical protein
MPKVKRSEKGLLTPDNCVVTLIDLQPQMLFGVANFDRQAIINNNVALGKATRVFEVPFVLSSVETKSFSVLERVGRVSLRQSAGRNQASCFCTTHSRSG